MAVKICDNCGEDNKENSIVCKTCSKILNDANIKGTLDSEKKSKLNQIRFN